MLGSTLSAGYRSAAAAFVLGAALALPASGAAQEQPGDTAVLQPLIEAAKAKGLNVVVIGPQPPAPAAAPVQTGNSLAALGGRVTKRLQAIVEDASKPGWPVPSSDPMKPLLNGILTVVGLLAGLVIARRLGLEFRPRYHAGSPEKRRLPCP